MESKHTAECSTLCLEAVVLLKLLFVTGVETISLHLKFHLASQLMVSIHSDEGLTLETSVFESFTVANLPYRPCG